MFIRQNLFSKYHLQRVCFALYFQLLSLCHSTQAESQPAPMQRTTTNVLRYVVQQHNTILITYNIPSLMKYSAMKAKSKKLLGYIVRDCLALERRGSSNKIISILAAQFCGIVEQIGPFVKIR